MMELRPGEPHDSEELSSLAHTSKNHWGYPPEWIAAWRDELTLSPDYIAANNVVVALSDGAAVGCYALERQEDQVELAHFWIHPEAIGKGLGRRLFLDAVDRVREMGVTRIQILSDPNAERFYLKMGARRVDLHVTEVCGHTRELPIMSFEAGR